LIGRRECDDVCIIFNMADPVVDTGAWPPLKEEMTGVQGSDTFAMNDEFNINELGALDGKLISVPK